jgi:hypothetical protein
MVDCEISIEPREDEVDGATAFVDSVHRSQAAVVLKLLNLTCTNWPFDISSARLLSFDSQDASANVKIQSKTSTIGSALGFLFDDKAL